MNAADIAEPRDRDWFQQRVRLLIARRDDEAALETCEAGLATWRWHPVLWQYKLQLLTRLGRHSAALALAEDRSALTAPARRKPGFQMRAFELFLAMQDFTAARERLAVVGDCDPGPGATYLLCAGRLGMASGDHGAALAVLEPNLARFPDNRLLHAVCARNMAAAGRLDDAMALLAARPSPEMQAVRAEILMAAGRNDEAAATLDRLGDRLAMTPRLALERVRLHESAGERAAALALLDRALPVCDDDTGLIAARWRLLARDGQVDAAIADCTVRAGRSGASLPLLTAAIRFLNEVEAPQEADTIFAKARAAYPESARLLQVAAGAALNRRFDPMAALALLDEWAAAHPGDDSMARLRARTLQLAGFPARAIEGLEALRAQRGLDAEAALLLARLLSLLGRFDAARAALDGIDRNSRDLYRRKYAILAGVAFGETHLRRARDNILRAISLHIRSPGDNEGEDLDELAKYQMLAGDYGAAWENHLTHTDMAHRRGGGAGTSNKPVRSMIGQVLNECRLFFGSRDGFGLRWDADADAVAEACAFYRAELDRSPGNTPAAIALLGALRRAGAIRVTAPAPTSREERIPRIIHQFWDAPAPPVQVAEVMDSNRKMNPDYEYRRFDLAGAQAYLLDKGEDAAVNAFCLTVSAAGKSDILRLAVLWHEGGVWLDADDRCVAPLSDLLDHRLRLVGYQETFWTLGNNFLAVAPRDPIIRAALEDAIGGLTGPQGNSVWMASGPGALSRALAGQGTDGQGRLAPGIWVMPVHRMMQAVVPHVRLPYKSSDVHWLRRLSAREG